MHTLNAFKYKCHIRIIVARVTKTANIFLYAAILMNHTQYRKLAIVPQLYTKTTNLNNKKRYLAEKKHNSNKYFINCIVYIIAGLV